MANEPDELATLRGRVETLERETIAAALRAWPETNDVGAEPGLLIDELAGERDALRAENARLREALEAIKTMPIPSQNEMPTSDFVARATRFRDWVHETATTALARTEAENG